MSERDRPDIDSELEFEFFDEPSRREAKPRPDAPPRRRPRLPAGPPPTRGLLRLATLIGAALLIAVVLVLVVNSCRASQKRGEYQHYMDAVAALEQDSAAIGRQLNALVTTPGITVKKLAQGLDALADQHALLVEQAHMLDPPGPLREEQRSLIESLQFRLSGLGGLGQAVSEIGKATDAESVGEALEDQASRLVASDVVYEDLFRARAQAVLRDEGVSGIAVPEGAFVQDFQFTNADSWTLLVKRLTETPSSGGLHGNMIYTVRALPQRLTLSTTEDNKVIISDRLVFQVVVQNSGDNQETRVEVTLTIQQDQPIERQKTIDVINPDELKSVSFGNLSPSFGSIATLKVSIKPVGGETNIANNTAEYPVLFAFE